MNLALFMLTFMLSGLYATESYSQTVRISLNMKNSTVKEVLKDLSISDILTTILPNCSQYIRYTDYNSPEL